MRYTGWSYNGLTFGEGTNIAVVESEGFDDLPEVRSADQMKAGAHGAFAGLDLLGERTMTLTLAVQGTDRTSYDALVQRLANAFTVQASELPLLCGDSGNRLVYVRPRKLSIPRKMDYHGVFHPAAMVQLVATDPRVYDATLTTLSTGLAATSGGMTFNATFPLGFGSGASGGAMTAVNLGPFTTEWQATIAGDCTNPVIENLTTGQTLSFAITLGVGDSLVVDSRGKRATLNGTASRIYTLQPGSAWWTLPAGATLIRFRNNGPYSAAAQLTLTYRSAWMALASGGA